MKAEQVTSTLECVSIWLFTMDAANFTFGAPIGVLQSPLSAPKGKWPQSRPRSSQQIEIHGTMQPANGRPLRSLSLASTSNSDDLIQFTKSTASPTGGTWHTEMNENGKTINQKMILLSSAIQAATGGRYELVQVVHCCVQLLGAEESPSSSSSSRRFA